MSPRFLDNLPAAGVVRIGRVQLQTRRLANRIKRFATRLTVTPPLVGSLPTEEEGVSSSASFHTSVHVRPCPPFNGFLFRQTRPPHPPGIRIENLRPNPSCSQNILHGKGTDIRKDKGLLSRSLTNLLQFHFSPHNAERQNFLGLISRLRKASSLRLNLN